MTKDEARAEQVKLEARAGVDVQGTLERAFAKAKQRIDDATAEAAELSRYCAMGAQWLHQNTEVMVEQFKHLFIAPSAPEDALVLANAEVVRLTTELAAKQERNKRLSEARESDQASHRAIVEAKNQEIDALAIQLSNALAAAAELNAAKQAWVDRIKGEGAQVPQPDPVAESVKYQDGTEATGSTPLPRVSPGGAPVAEPINGTEKGLNGVALSGAVDGDVLTTASTK